MAKTVIGLFDRFEDAQQVVREFNDRGYHRDEISLIANDASGQYRSLSGGSTSGGGEGVVRSTDGSAGETAESAATGATAGSVLGGALGLLAGIGALAIPGIGPVIAAGPIATALGSTALGAGLGAATGAAAGGLVGALGEAGVPEADAQLYAEGVRRGGALVSARVPDDQADDAVAIMNRYGAVDIDQRGGYYRESGYTGFNANAAPYSAAQIRTYRDQNPSVYTRATAASTGTVGATGAVTGDRDQVAIPIVEEQLQVGKREIERGGVRIYTHVEERPVEEQVTLREENVTVERRPVDRAVTEGDMAAFREGTIELTETAEVPVVSKEARVVEEVIVGKETTQHTETVRDTVRRTDVDVQELDADDASVTQTTPSTASTRTSSSH
jgi:uncharacterized protein (TIGR02271 family)